MIENLQGEFWELEDKKCFKTFFKVLQRQTMKNQTIQTIFDTI